MSTDAQQGNKLRTVRDAMASLRHVAYGLRDVFLGLRILLIPACLSAFASLVLFLPDQTRDYYRLLVENLADPSIDVTQDAALLEAIVPIILLLVMAVCLSFSAIVLLAERSRPGLYRTACVRRSVRFLPVVFGTLPLLGAVGGFRASANAINLKLRDASIAGIKAFPDEKYLEQLQHLFNWAEQGTRYYNTGLCILRAVAVAFLLASILAVLLDWGADRVRLWRITRRAFTASIVLSLAAIVLIAAFPVPIGRALGSIAVFAIFIGCLTINATGLSIWSRRLDFPIIPALLVVAGFLAWTDLNDDHELRRVDRNGQAVSPSMTATQGPAGDVADAFEEWYNLRIDKDQDEFKKQGYPVYIVAAQGGGIYAAAQAVQFLTKLHTTCKRFAQHLFAISGVSGGSVGAALYAALTDEFKATTHQCRSIEVLGLGSPRVPQMKRAQQSAFELVRNDYDFLSPLVASALFPDFAQRFFWPPLPALSRARALEQSIELGWEDIAAKRFKGTGRGALRNGILASWNPGGLKPALFFNTTEVGSGRRRIIAPFRYDAKFRTDAQFLPLSEDYDVPLSVAAVASARFPWLTPAAWFWGNNDAAPLPANGEVAKFHVVDGGYFENSGVTTAVEIINRLQLRAQVCCKNARFYLIVLTSGEYSKDQSGAFSEAVSPVVALFNTRTARTYSTVDLATRDLGVVDPSANGILGRLSRLQKADFGDWVIPLPLGWRLSKMSATEIFFLTGRAKHCVPDDSFAQTSGVKGFGPVDCVQLLILHQLRGDDLDVALAKAQARHPPKSPEK